MIKVNAINKVMCSGCKKVIKVGELYWFGTKNRCIKCGDKQNVK